MLAGCTFGDGGIAASSAADDGTETTADTGAGSQTTVASTTSPTTTGSVSTSDDGGESEQGGTTIGLDDGTTAADLTTTGPGDDDTGTDSSGDTGEALPDGPFGDPVRIDELSDGDAEDDDPTVRGDELEIYFNSNRSGGSELLVSVRDDPDDPWGPPVLASPLNDAEFGDTTPKLTPDGLAIYFSSNRPPSEAFDIWVATRPDLEADWSSPVRVQELSSPTGDFGATVYGNTMFLCSDRDGTLGELDVWELEIINLANGNFGAASNATTLNGIGQDCTLGMRADGLEVFIERRPAMDKTTWDLWRATRAQTDVDWSPPELATELNSTGNDNDPWMSQDGTRLYFASRRNGSKRRDLYVASR